MIEKIKKKHLFDKTIIKKIMGKWNINIYWSNQREKHPLVIQNKYFFELKIKYLICKFFVLIRCFIIYTLFLLSIWVLIKTRRCKLLRSTTDKWMLIKVTNIGHWWVCAIHYQLRCKVSVFFFLSLITAQLLQKKTMFFV